MAQQRVETLLFCQPAGRSIAVQPPADGATASPGLFSFTLQSTGGATFIQDLISSASVDGTLIWQVENGATGSVQLVEFDANMGMSHPAVTLEFQSQLFPGIAMLGVNGKLVIVGLTGTGYLFSLALSDGSLQSANASNVHFVDLSSHWQSVGAPTYIAATVDHVVIGGSGGPVLCIPSVLLDKGHESPNGNSARPFELRESSWGLKGLIAGVWQARRSPSVVAILPVAQQLAGEQSQQQQPLLVVYDDCTMRGFNIARHAQLFTETLEADSSTARGMTPTFAAACWAPLDSKAGAMTDAQQALVVVVQFEANDTLQKASAAFVFAPAAGRFVLRQRIELSVEASATVVSAHVSGDVVWTLLKAPGTTRLVGFSRADGGRQCAAAELLQQQEQQLALQGWLHGAAAARPGQDAMLQELWESAISSFPPSAPSSSGSGTFSSASAGCSAADQVLAHITSPASLCRASLRDALSYYGAQLSGAEVEAAGLELLVVYITAAVQTVQRRNPGQSLPRCWLLFLATYREAWSRRHPALSLMARKQAQDGWLGVVRGGGTLGVLRRAAAVEVLAQHGAAPAPAGPAAVALLPAAEQVVHAAACGAASLLGAQALDTFVAQLAAGVDITDGLLERYCGLWLGGPNASSSSSRQGPAVAAAARDDVSREQHSAWRQRRQQLLLQVGQTLGALPDPVAAVRQYCSHLALQPLSGASAAATSGSSSGASGRTARGNFLVAAARQLAYSQASAARDLALLLAVVRRTCAIGCVPLNASQLGALHEVLVQQVVPLLQRAALVYWLATTHTTAADTTPSDGEAQLTALAQQLRLTSSPTDKRPRVSAPGGSGAGTLRDSVLAARLLPASGAGGALKALDAAAVEFVRQLQYGSGSGAAGEAPVAERVLHLGYRLFLTREYAPLEALTWLAGGAGGSSAAAGGSGSAAAAAGPELLRGLSLACRLGGWSGTARAAAVAQAGGCFFRAGASLGTASDAALPGILRSLQQQLTGLQPEQRQQQQAGGSSSAAADAWLQLDLCETAMLLFDREGAPDGAVMFARAALQHLPAAYGRSGCCPPAVGSGAADEAAPVPQGQEDCAYAEREGRLWSNIFTYCCALGRYEEAYAALASNPVPERALDCARRLVHELCEAGEVVGLCGLPLAGAVRVAAGSGYGRGGEDGAALEITNRWRAELAARLRDPAQGALPALPQHLLQLLEQQQEEAAAVASPSAGGHTPTALVTLLDEVVATLQRRAHNLDVSAQPQPYRVLYDFLLSRCDCRGAARAMVAYARRLRVDGPRGRTTAAEALAAYDAAANALSLCDPEDAWLDMTDPWMRLHAQPGRPMPPPLLPGAAGAAAAAAGSAPEPLVLDLPGLLRERELLRGAVLVAHSTPGYDPLKAASPEDVFSALTTAGHTDAALTLAHACWQGAALTSAVERAVAALAAQCVRVQLGRDGVSAAAGGSSSVLALLQAAAPEEQEVLLGQAQLGARAAPLWTKLKAVLEQYEGLRVGGEESGSSSSVGGADGPRVHAGRLRVAVADAALRVEPRVALPLWLLDMFEVSGEAAGMGGNACGPASLLSLYLTHGRLAEAVQLVVRYVEAWSRADPRLRKRHNASWWPYEQMQLLRELLQVEVERGASGASALTSRLQGATQKLRDLAEHDCPVAGPSAAGMGASAPLLMFA